MHCYTIIEISSIRNGFKSNLLNRNEVNLDKSYVTVCV